MTKGAMTHSLVFSQASITMTGVLLLALVTVETGGLYLLTQLFVDQTSLSEPVQSFARSGVAVSALLMPGGFFLIGGAWT